MLLVRVVNSELLHGLEQGICGHGSLSAYNNFCKASKDGTSIEDAWVGSTQGFASRLNLGTINTLALRCGAWLSRLRSGNDGSMILANGTVMGSSR